MVTNKEIDEYRELMKQYENIAKTSILENCNKIIQIGAYTAELDDNKKIILSRTKFPSQFSEKSATKIVNMDWLIANDKKANVQIYNVKEWYKEKIQSLNFIINNFNFK